jgi:hypothetical protein
MLRHGYSLNQETKMRHLKLLMAVCAGFSMAACDSDSPVQPRWSAPTRFSFSTVASGIAASVVSSSEIDLTWPHGGPQVDGFQLFRSTTGPTGSYSLVASTAASVTSYADVGLNGGTSYCYELRSFKMNGRNIGYSAFSGAACVTTKLEAPSGTQAMPVNSSNIRVSWSNSSGNQDGFRVEQASSVDGPWTSGSTAAANATSLVLSVASEQRICYRVLAFNAAGNSLPSTPDCTAAPAPPTNLVAAQESGGVKLTWQDNSGFEFGYIIESSTDGVTFTGLVRLPANTSSFLQAGVGSGTTYWYRAAATRDGGTSDLSNIAHSAGGCVATSDTEDCYNGLDDNCDGLVDTADPSCGELTDCNFNTCGSGSICVASYGMLAYCQSSCGDSYKDSDEADVDCGGGCGSTCQVDQQCWGNWDCASNNCVYTPGAFQGVCHAPVSQP